MCFSGKGNFGGRFNEKILRLDVPAKAQECKPQSRKLLHPLPSCAEMYQHSIALLWKICRL